MTPSKPALEIQVCLANGKHATFFQNDESVSLQILNSIQPNKVFNQPHLIIASDHSMTAFSPQAIARLDLISPHFVPQWPFPQGIREMREISESDFIERRQASIKAATSAAGGGSDLLREHIVVGLSGGYRLFLETLAKIDAEAEKRHLVNHLFQMNSFWARRHGGGVTIVNPIHLLRLTLYPCPSPTPLQAWPAQPLRRQKPTGRQAGESAQGPITHDT